MNKKYTLVSLFCGAGGLDLGFVKNGFNCIYATDADKDACTTHEKWSKSKIVCENINKLDLTKIPKSDVIAGGFPCQGFSLAGPRKLDDSRNALYKKFVELVSLNKPKVFIAENVKGLLTLGNGNIKDAIIKDFEDKGYKLYINIVNASNYNVPQDRERIIIIGVRKDIDIEFKCPVPNKEKSVLKDVLSKSSAPLKEDICFDNFSSRYMSRNRKRKMNEPSFTIVAQAKQIPLHPFSPDMKKISKDKFEFGIGATRRLSYKECALIQTFPEEIEFYGNLNSKYKQIGNAVPVNLAGAFAKSIYELLEKM